MHLLYHLHRLGSHQGPIAPFINIVLFKNSWRSDCNFYRGHIESWTSHSMPTCHWGKFQPSKSDKKYFCNCYEIRHLLYAKLSVLGIIEIHPMAFFRCQLSLLRTIERDPITSFRCQLSLLWIIGSCPTASFRCRSSCLWIIRKMPIAPFIPIESFSNSSKFGHRVVYSIAPIIR